MALGRRQTTYYETQNGHGRVPVFRLQRLQRGSGFGGLFKGLLKFALPMVKKGLLHVGSRALTAGANALQDVSENKATVKQAFKNRAIEALHPLNLLNSGTRKRKASTPARNLINSGAQKRKASTPGKPSKSKVKRTARNSGKLVAPSF